MLDLKDSSQTTKRECQASRSHLLTCFATHTAMLTMLSLNWAHVSRGTRVDKHAHLIFQNAFMLLAHPRPLALACATQFLRNPHLGSVVRARAIEAWQPCFLVQSDSTLHQFWPTRERVAKFMQVHLHHQRQHACVLFLSLQARDLSARRLRRVRKLKSLVLER